MSFPVLISVPTDRYGGGGLNGYTVYLKEVGEDIYLLTESSTENRFFKKGTLFKGKVEYTPETYPPRFNPERYDLREYQIIRFGMVDYESRLYRINHKNYAKEEVKKDISEFLQSPAYQDLSKQIAAIGGEIEQIPEFFYGMVFYIHIPKEEASFFEDIENRQDLDFKERHFQE